MAKKKNNKNFKSTLLTILFITCFLGAFYYYFTLQDEVSAQEFLPFQQTEKISEQEAVDQTASDKASLPAADKKNETLLIKNLEIPICSKNAVIITESDNKGILETPEKEDSHQIIYHNGFTLCYREKFEQPEWVCYTLNAEKVKKNVARKDNFRPDPKVLTGSAELSDYKESGYDRGHLCPSADLTYSAETMDESFVLSNMSPQKAKFNRGMWKDLEHEIRTLTEHYENLYIVTGPVLEKSQYQTVGTNQVAVPEYYYKALLGIKEGKYFMIGFILPNTKCEGTIWDYAVSVDEIEKRCDIDFFSLLNDDEEKQLEQTVNISDWKFN